MSFIDKFLDVTNNLPRKIVRILKLYKFVENLSRDINTDLKKSRVIYLEKIKEKEPKESEIITIKNSIDKNFKELLTLSDYKKELINELKYILENNFLNKIAPIIEEGKKECQEQIHSASNMNIPYSSNFINPVYAKMNSDELSISEFNEKNKKSEKMLGLKTNRNNRNRNKKIGPGNSEYNEYSEEIQKNVLDGEVEKVYCICQKPGYGKMIECDTCKEWFHLDCMGIKEGSEPKDWSCPSCLNGKKKVSKKKKKNTS